MQATLPKFSNTLSSHGSKKLCTGQWNSVQQTQKVVILRYWGVLPHSQKGAQRWQAILPHWGQFKECFLQGLAALIPSLGRQRQADFWRLIGLYILPMCDHELILTLTQ